MRNHLSGRAASVTFAICCLCVFTLGPGVEAEGAARPGYTLESPPADMLGAHSERMLVIFGTEVHFKRYFLVDMLSQSMTVATDVAGGVRYDLRQSDHGRTLVIP